MGMIGVYYGKRTTGMKTKATHMEDDFNNFLCTHPDFYRFFLARYAVDKPFLIKSENDWKGALVIDIENFCEKLPKPTLSAAWDALCNDPWRNAGEILCMFAEAAFLESDRRRLCGIYVALLLTVKDSFREPFDGFLREMKKALDGTDADRKALRASIEAFCDTVDKHDLYHLTHDYERRGSMPKQERVKIKDDIQNARLSTVFLLALDAMLCKHYSPGKLLLFWRGLCEYELVEREGTMIGEYGRDVLDRDETRHVRFAEIGNPFNEIQ